jgi:hypothetical protein
MPHKRPSYDTIMRARLSALLQRQDISTAETARRAGWSESTLHRKLNFGEAGPSGYRKLSATDIDKLLAAMDLKPEAMLHPVLLDGDRDALVWIGTRTPVDPLPSDAMLDGFLGLHLRVRLTRLVRQGLVEQHSGDSGEFLRLTESGQRALR